MLRSEVTVLSDMPSESKCVIVKINGHGSFRRRIMETSIIAVVTIVKIVVFKKYLPKGTAVNAST